MSNLKHTAESVKNLAKQYASVIEMGKFLESVSSLDNLADELEAKVAELREQTDKAQVELNLAVTAKADAIREAEAKLSHAQAEAEQIVATAKGDRAQIIDEAKAQAAAIREEAESLLTSANAACEQRASAAADLDTVIKSKHEELERINTAIAEARAKLGV